MAVRAHIAISVGGQPVGYLRDASVDEQHEMLPCAAPEVYGYRAQIPGVSSWSASASVFVPSGAADPGQEGVRDAITGRSTVALVFTFQNGSTESGTGLITGWEVSGEIGGAVEGSFQLQGVGALS